MKKKEFETWLLPVYGEQDKHDRCRALVWRVSREARKYLLSCMRRFKRVRNEDPGIEHMAYRAVPVDVRWVNDEKYDVIEKVPEFDDAGEPMTAEGLYDKMKWVPEFDTDDDLLYVNLSTFSFRVRLADTTEWYTAEMHWWMLEGMFND